MRKLKEFTIAMSIIFVLIISAYIISELVAYEMPAKELVHKQEVEIVEPNKLGYNWDTQAEFIEADLGPYSIMIRFGEDDGKIIEMEIDKDEFIISGDTEDMNEAAEIFFNELLKPLVDDYFKTKKRPIKGFSAPMDIHNLIPTWPQYIEVGKDLVIVDYGDDDMYDFKMELAKGTKIYFKD